MSDQSERLLEELDGLRLHADHYRTLLDDSSDPIFSFYPDGTYRYVNRAFAVGVEMPVDQIIGHRIWDVFSPDEADKRFAVVKKVFAEGVTVEIEVRVPVSTGDQYYLTTAKPVFDPDGGVESVICTSKNITSRMLAELALKEEHDRLQRALEEIDTLSGLLPLCASCHSVRDDEGYWAQLEAYVQEHTRAQFTHTICPDCAAEIYPDLQLPR